jgi:two-component system chemotaxis response regulator CheY
MAKKVLIVDDSTSMRNVISMTLQGAGYDVLEAQDGQSGLTRLDGQKLNLIITDINMPVMDGLTFVKEVKKQAAYKFTPIIVLTTETDAAKRDVARASGAKAWVVKPFQPQQLLDAVSKLVLP